ncbi:MAG: hypothetical protein MH825_13125 [Cyanobacteria bacterium]|nr:hypothetical protein [Cyanobacteriota bacterium]
MSIIQIQTQAHQWVGAWLSAGFTPDRIRKEAAAREMPEEARRAIADALLAYAADCAIRPQHSPEAIRGALARLAAGGLDLSDLRQWCRQNLNRADLDVAERLLKNEESRRAALPAARPDAIAPWSVLLPQGDRFKHVLILGSTNGGKTCLTEWLGHQQPGFVRVLTTKRKATQWRGMEVIGHPRDYAALKVAWEALISEMDRRLGLIDHAGTAYQHLNVLVDELPAQAANLGKDHQHWLSTLLRESRESLIRLFVLVQGGQLKTIGLEGESDLKGCLHWVRLGKFARSHAQKLYRDGLCDRAALDWVLQQRYPATIDDAIAEVPDLTHWQPGTASHTFPSPSTAEAFRSHGSPVVVGASTISVPSQEADVDPQKLQTVRLLMGSGVSKTRAIEQVFGCSGGRQFQRISSLL